MADLRRLIRPLLVAAALAATALAAPAASHAATLQQWAGCGGGFNAGTFDAAGNTYVPCGNPTTIAVYAPSGALVDQIATSTFHTDVAPTRDGAIVYAAGPAGPIRYRRAANGAWSRDASWHAARYPIWGTSYAAGGYYVAVDALGNSYYADGMWAGSNVNTVVKYDSAGRFVTRFGEWAKSWALGGFYWNVAGIAVNADGSRVYTAEVGNNRVQVWHGEGGAYVAKRSFGATAATDPGRTGGTCDYAGWTGVFAASYDVNLDAAGNVYVLNTTCKQVLVFDPALTRMIANHDVRIAGGADVRPHGFAVGADGTVFVGETARVVHPGGVAVTGPPKAPAPGAPTPAPGAATPLTSAPSASAPRVDPPPAARPANAGVSTGGRASKITLSVPSVRTRVTGPRAKRRLALTVRCAPACSSRITVSRAGRTIGTRSQPRRAGTARISVPLTRARTAGFATIRIVAVNARGVTSTRAWRVWIGR